VFAGQVTKNLVFSGIGGRYTLTFRAAGVSRYRSFNFRERFIRHSNFPGELTPLVTPLDFADSLFELAPGLMPGNIAVSLRSANFPNHFLRHQNTEVKLQAPAGPNDEQFKNDATFLVEPGFADPRGVSFRSFNFRERFLRHRNFRLFVEAGSGDTFANDATFLID
jgi:Alpha-L-arabinofuranosidase B (ABFB) domain